MSVLEEFREALRTALADRSLAGTAVEAGLPRDAIRSVLVGHDPRLSRAVELADALGLEFYVGPPRAGPDHGAIRKQLREVAAELERLQARAARAAGLAPEVTGEATVGGTDGSAPASANDADDVPGARPVDVVELAAAAGGGADAASEEVVGRLWFRRDWLDRRSLDPARCAVIGVTGESMEPTLPDGCSILVDRARTRRRRGRVYVLRTGDGLIAKRAGKDDDGGWLLESDHPAWEPVPWPDDAETVGEVIWTARSLIGEVRQ